MVSLSEDYLCPCSCNFEDPDFDAKVDSNF